METERIREREPGKREGGIGLRAESAGSESCSFWLGLRGGEFFAAFEHSMERVEMEIKADLPV